MKRTFNSRNSTILLYYPGFEKDLNHSHAYMNQRIAKHTVNGYILSDTKLDQVNLFTRRVFNFGTGRYMSIEDNSLYWLLKELTAYSLYCLPLGLTIIGRVCDADIAAKLTESLRSQAIYAISAHMVEQKLRLVPATQL